MKKWSKVAWLVTVHVGFCLALISWTMDYVVASYWDAPRDEAGPSVQAAPETASSASVLRGIEHRDTYNVTKPADGRRLAGEVRRLIAPSKWDVLMGHVHVPEAVEFACVVDEANPKQMMLVITWHWPDGKAPKGCYTKTAMTFAGMPVFIRRAGGSPQVALLVR